MYSKDVTYKHIRLRISHSYDTFMDDTNGQREIHFKALEDMYDPERFTDPGTMRADIIAFLHELQDEVDIRVSISQYGLPEGD